MFFVPFAIFRENISANDCASGLLSWARHLFLFFINIFCIVVFTGVDVKSEDEKIRGETGEDWDEIYACDYCDQAFTNSNDLVEHQETHPEANDEQTMDDSS